MAAAAATRERVLRGPHAPDHMFDASTLREGRCESILSKLASMELPMTFRPPQSLRRFDAGSGVNVLEYELMAERADALGRHGLKVEKAIAALNGFDREKDQPEERRRLLDEAADAVWAFFIQREICGLRDSRDAVRRYGIPKEVMARLGIVRKR